MQNTSVPSSSPCPQPGSALDDASSHRRAPLSRSASTPNGPSTTTSLLLRTSQGKVSPSVALSSRPLPSAGGIGFGSTASPQRSLAPTSLVPSFQANAVGLPNNFLLKPIVGPQTQPTGGWGSVNGPMTAGQRRVNSSVAASQAANAVDPSVSTALFKQLQPRGIGTPNITVAAANGSDSLVSPSNGGGGGTQSPPPIPLFQYPSGYGPRRLAPSPTAALVGVPQRKAKGSSSSVLLSPTAATATSGGAAMGSNNNLSISTPSHMTMNTNTDAYLTSNNSPTHQQQNHNPHGSQQLHLPGDSMRQISAWPATNAKSVTGAAAQSALMGKIDARPGALTKALLDERHGDGTANTLIANAIKTAKHIAVLPANHGQGPALSVHLLTEEEAEEARALDAAEAEDDDDAKWDALVGLSEDAVLERPVPQSTSHSRAVSPPSMTRIGGGGHREASYTAAGGAVTSPGSIGRRQGRAGAMGRKGSFASPMVSSPSIGSPTTGMLMSSGTAAGPIQSITGVVAPSAATAANGRRTPAAGGTSNSGGGGGGGLVAALHSATATSATLGGRSIKPHALEQLEQLLVDSAARLRFEFPEEHQIYQSAIIGSSSSCVSGGVGPIAGRRAVSPPPSPPLSQPNFADDSGTLEDMVLVAPYPRRMLPTRRFNSRGMPLVGAAAARSSGNKTGGKSAGRSLSDQQQRSVPFTNVLRDEEVSWDGTTATAAADIEQPSGLVGKTSSFRKIPDGEHQEGGAVCGESSATSADALGKKSVPKTRRTSAHRTPSPQKRDITTTSTALTVASTAMPPTPQYSPAAAGPPAANPLTDAMWTYLDRRLQSHRHAAELFFTIFESYRPVLSQILDEYESHLAFVLSNSTAEQDYWRAEAERYQRENRTLQAALQEEQRSRRMVEGEVDGLRAQITVLRHAETELKEQKIIFEHEQHMNRLQQEQNEADKTALTRKMMALEEQIEGLNQQLAEPGRAIERLNAQIAAKNSHVHSLSASIDRMSSENASLRRQVASIRAKEAAVAGAAAYSAAAASGLGGGGSGEAAASAEEARVAKTMLMLQEAHMTIAQHQGTIANQKEKMAIMRHQLDQLLLASGGIGATIIGLGSSGGGANDSSGAELPAFNGNASIEEANSSAPATSRRSSAAVPNSGRAKGTGPLSSDVTPAQPPLSSRSAAARGTSGMKRAPSNASSSAKTGGGRKGSNHSTTAPPSSTPIVSSPTAKQQQQHHGGSSMSEAGGSTPASTGRSNGEHRLSATTGNNSPMSRALQQYHHEISSASNNVHSGSGNGAADLDHLASMYTPRPHIVSADLAQAQTTAERMTLAISTIAQLKTELNTSRARVADLLTMRSMSLQGLVGRMSDVFSSTCASYHHPCFQDTMLAFNHPATRWFIGYGDGHDDTKYPYLRAVGRQRNQRFSLGAVKWHIHTFFTQCPPSWRGTGAAAAGGEAFGDKLQRWIDSKYPIDSPSMCYSFHTSLDWFSTIDTDCYLVKAMLDGELDEGSWRRSTLIVSRLRVEMERLQAQQLVTLDPSARINTAAAVDEILGIGAASSPTNNNNNVLLDGPAPTLPPPPSSPSSMPTHLRRRVSATFINDSGLPERCFVNTPKTVSGELAVRAITNTFSLWSSESISELVRALENAAQEAAAAAASGGVGGARSGGGGMSAADKDKYNHRKSMVTTVSNSGGGAAQPMNLRGNNSSAVQLSLASLFDPVNISSGHMESYFTSAVRTLWLIESHTYVSDVIECLLEKSASAAGRVTPQMVVSAVMEADIDCPGHIVHDTVESVFLQVRPNGLPLDEENRDAPIHDRYLKYGDVNIPLTQCIRRLRKIGPARHTHRSVYQQMVNHKTNIAAKGGGGGGPNPSSSAHYGSGGANASSSSDPLTGSVISPRSQTQ